MSVFIYVVFFSKLLLPRLCTYMCFQFKVVLWTCLIFFKLLLPRFSCEHVSFVGSRLDCCRISTCLCFATWWQHLSVELMVALSAALMTMRIMHAPMTYAAPRWRGFVCVEGAMCGEMNPKRPIPDVIRQIYLPWAHGWTLLRVQLWWYRYLRQVPDILRYWREWTLRLSDVVCTCYSHYSRCPCWALWILLGCGSRHPHVGVATLS